MDMSTNTSPYRLARLPGHQGARPSAGNQAEDDKFATGKRFRSNSDEFQNMPSVWNRYLIITGTDDRFSKVSAIAIYNALKKIIGEPEDTRRLQDGSVLVKVGNSRQSENILNLKGIDGASVEVKPHKTLNTCKGTVVSRESHRCTDKELNEWLSDRRVIEIKRIKLRKHPLELLILTFQGEYLPTKIPVGFEWCKVRQYIPNPRRCFKCQRYGHIINNCRNKERCANCGACEHTHSKDSPCTKKANCVNCGEEHPAYDRHCQKWILEKEVQKLKVEKDISFPMARRLAEQIKGPVTYASVTTITPSPRNSPRKRVQLDPNHRYTKNQSPSKHSTQSQISNTPQSQKSNTRDHFEILFQQKNFAKQIKPLTLVSDIPSGVNDSQESDSDSMEVMEPTPSGISDNTPVVVTKTKTVKKKPLSETPKSSKERDIILNRSQFSKSKKTTK